MSHSLTVIYWRDIPAQILIGRGRNAIKRPLSERFEKAIDRAAMVSGMDQSDDYLSEWKRISQGEVEGDIESVANIWLERLEKDYPQERLAQLANNGGNE